MRFCQPTSREFAHWNCKEMVLHRETALSESSAQSADGSSGFVSASKNTSENHRMITDSRLFSLKWRFCQSTFCENWRRSDLWQGEKEETCRPRLRRGRETRAERETDLPSRPVVIGRPVIYSAWLAPDPGCRRAPGSPHYCGAMPLACSGPFEPEFVNDV